VQERLERIAGKEITPELILSLPDDVDVCGENGEFHTFAFKGPVFKNEIKYKRGEKVYRSYKAPESADTVHEKDVIEKSSGFWFCDLLPA
jgi:diphthamide synthase (EF-2-diphthine--ammonia ligase)